jgi:hypothetical protein
VSQINFSYGIATKGQQQAHLHLLGASGFVKQQLHAQMPHVEQWALTVSDDSYAEHFKVRVGPMVADPTGLPLTSLEGWARGVH